MFRSLISKLFHRKTVENYSREIFIGRHYLNSGKYPKNLICNQKYNIFTFFPLVLFQQFRIFINLYFLILACVQIVPIFRTGYLYTYWLPLGFVFLLAVLRESIDDLKRAYRDRELNSQQYFVIDENGHKRQIASSELQVSDIIIIERNQRVPADVILLQTSDRSGTCYIRTDQLDGETDWKLRIAAPLTQSIEDISVLISDKNIAAKIYAGSARINIHEFDGIITLKEEQPLTIENILWSGSVLTTADAICCVIYTGSETLMAKNTNKPRSKIGLLDHELNTLTKLLFAGVIILSTIMIILKGFHGLWYVHFVRYAMLFSYMTPISLRINLDLAKIVYGWFMQADKTIPGTLVRTNTIPEELGRIGFVLADKTGTLTRNQMIFKRIHLGTCSYTNENRDELSSLLNQYYQTSDKLDPSTTSKKRSPIRKTSPKNVLDAIKALALCHNVTPVLEHRLSSIRETDESLSLIDKSTHNQAFDTYDLTSLTGITYQASSPDEIAIVEWTEQIGLTLIYRDLKSITLQLNSTQESFNYEILQLFPFKSETKRMGIIVRDKQTDEIIFYLKGSDVVMQNIVQYNDWLEEECSNMAREGLRTLVVAKKVLSEEYYKEFEQNLLKARLKTTDRQSRIYETIQNIENDMNLLCITGVDDKLQENVRQTLETLRHAGIKTWMLTGDKLETAVCIAKSSKLIGRNNDVYIFKQVKTREECLQEINSYKQYVDACLVITGDTLQICLGFNERELTELAIQSTSVVVCRCSPTQKSHVVDVLRKYINPKVRICAIGDGGNDVTMIQNADVGIGIVGKEGKQASLAADFSIEQFSYMSSLLLVHGQNSYKRSASISQFILYRGLILSTLQAIFSSVFYYATIPLYNGFILIGYITVFTMFPVFSLVLDEDVKSDVALIYPELYKSLSKGRSLSFKIFCLCVFVAIYQGSAIMYGSFLLFPDDFIHIPSITFTSLILAELILIALKIHTWHPMMIVAELLSFTCYILSLIIFKNQFDTVFLQSWSAIWRIILITCISCVPLVVLKLIQTIFKPTTHQKLMQYSPLK